MNSTQQSPLIKQNDWRGYALDQRQSSNVQVHKACVEDKIMTISAVLKPLYLAKFKYEMINYLDAKEFAFS